VHELEQVGFSEAMTIQRLLVDPQEQANLRDRVLIRGRSGNGLGPSDDGATAVHALPKPIAWFSRNRRQRLSC
jgi:hypothetical protein